MKIVSIEPTPSPNTMKITVDERLAGGEQYVYRRENEADAPDVIRAILAVEGVKSIFRAADFLAVERHPTAPWQPILAQVREAFGEETGDDPAGIAAPIPAQDAWGEVRVLVQMVRGIPLQVKLLAGSEERRVGLPERFARAVMRALASANVIAERTWEEQGVRYGTMTEVGEEVAQELDAAYDDERLARLVDQALAQHPGDLQPQGPEESLSTAELLDDPDWRKRFAALERMDPTPDDLPVLIKALRDDKPSIRRLAVVYLGMIGGPDVLPHLFRALKDESASVRRTAGDTLSDLGDPAAIGPMAEALQDANKLVRWRAARFLYEVGDETALPALYAAADDPEFEVSMQVKMAIERIERGEAASGTVWQQMTKRSDN